MAKDRTLRKNGNKARLIFRLLIPMLILVVLQLVIFFVTLVISGEFEYVEQYAYNTLVEKTENRKNYVENVFQQKMPAVREYAERINDTVAELLEEHGADIGSIKTDKELNRSIMESSLDDMVRLLRRSMANDVYLILDTGELYSGADGNSSAMAALYIRDLDTATDAGYSDLLMEMGLSSISKDFGIILDSGWKLYFEPDETKPADYDYYYKTVQTARENPGLSVESLGCWTGFSSLSRNSSPSLKYTVPLIADDGTVYGVFGIGMTENAILANMPVHDFMSETACYVLGHGLASENAFDIVTHSGTIFKKLVGDAEKLPIGETLDKNVCDFNVETSEVLAGCVQYLSIYSQDSPYRNEQWALISVADRNSVLRPLTTLRSMLVVAALVSFAISVLIVVFISREVVKPITSAIRTMNDNREYSQVISFEPSNIYEIDKMTDAITQLQINVQEFSSQVSKMIRIAHVGLGTFMYDRTDDTVFVGQSLLSMLSPDLYVDEDIVMDKEKFLESIVSDDVRFAVSKSLKPIEAETQGDSVREFSIPQEDGTMIWMRLSLVHTTNKSIGILQDVTNTIMEKKRIEYERDYDAITGLLNRHAYNNKLDSMFTYPEKLKVTAFIMIDLDNLKFVNDTYGHDFGDDYIKTAATSLKRFQKYGGIVSRLSGDEFNICLPGFDSKEEARKVIDEIREHMLSSYCLLADGTHYKIRASWGVSWYPDDGPTYDLLMKYADFAMYTIKHSTKGEIAEFDMTAYEKDSVLINGVEEMNRIIDERSIKYSFQSIVSAKTGEIYGYEALMRPQSTILQYPLELLRIAKVSAKLYEIERLTWLKSMADFKEQISAGRIAPNSHLFINSISNSLLEESDVDEIEKSHPELLPNIVLEILESENTNEDYIERKLARMKKWNAQIALDDFGTGYNSEYALITLHPNIIKIDRTIISGCDKDLSRKMIIQNLVKLARAKQILVLAEGVETEEELGTVISCGVDLLQGYYISRPVFEPTPIPAEIVETINRLAQGTV